MRSLFILSVFLFFIFGCGTSKLSDNEWKIEKEKVESCRSQWTYNYLNTAIELTLLLHDPKGRYDLVSWPNFFIGITAQNDTLGIIEYETEKKYEIGETIHFFPGKQKEGISAELESEMDEPIFTVSPIKKENDLYCAVKTIYYGKLVNEKNS